MIAARFGAALLFCAAAAAAGPWRAAWVWFPSPHTDGYLRYAFELPAEPVEAKVVVTADNIYTLYVNGKEVGRDSEWPTLETYDVTGLLHAGPNCIAVHGRDPGPDVGAVLLEGVVVLPGREIVTIATGPDWKISPEPAPGWNLPAFDDSDWAVVEVFGSPPVGPWGGFEHPGLVPPAAAELVSAKWPDRTPLGEPFALEVTLLPREKLLTEGPVAVALWWRGQLAYEQWFDPFPPMGEWRTGEPVTLLLDGFRPPIYLPEGSYELKVRGEGLEVAGAARVTVGDPAPVPALPEVRVEVAVSGSGTRRTLDARFTLSGALPEQAGSPRLGVRLFRGRELWAAVDVPPALPLASWVPGVPRRERLVLDLEGLPAGDYTAQVFVHGLPGHGEAPVRLPQARPDPMREPLGYGTYRDCRGGVHRWWINPQGALLWDGEPYVPVGGMYLSQWQMGFNLHDPKGNEQRWRNDLKKLTLLRERGVTDIYLNPCCTREERPAWVFERILSLFDEMGFRYGWQMTDHQLGGELTAWHVASDQHLLPARAGETVSARMTSGFLGKVDPALPVACVLIPRGGGAATVLPARVEPAADGIVASAGPLPEGFEGWAHFVPALRFSINGDMHDYWNTVDEGYLERMTLFYGSVPTGPGLRLIIDPLDNEQSWRDMHRMLPGSRRFREGFAAWLAARYSTLEGLARAWGMEEVPASFLEAASLVPGGVNPETGVDGYLCDLERGLAFAVDMRRCQFWEDALYYRDFSIRDFNNKAAEAIKAAIDVPIVLKGTDTSSFINERTWGGFDGLGQEAYGTGNELIRGCGGGVYARAKQSARSMWQLVTETGMVSGIEGQIGYHDPHRLVWELDVMCSMGAKGAYIFYLNAWGDPETAGFHMWNLFEDPRQLWWLGAYSYLLKTAPTLTAYEPLVDCFWPGAIAGWEGFARTDELPYKSDVPSQSVMGARGGWAVPVVFPEEVPGRVIVSLEDEPATLRWGPHLERLLASGRQVALVGMRRDLGALSVDRYYTPETAVGPQARRVQVVRPPRGARVTHTTADGRPYGFEHGNLAVLAIEGWKPAVAELTRNARPGFDFERDVLQAQLVKFGRTHQIVHARGRTYIWCGSDSPAALRVSTEALPGRTAVARLGLAEIARSEGALEFTVTPGASWGEPVVIDGATLPEVSGWEPVERAAADAAFERAAAFYSEATGEEPAAPAEEASPEEVFARADELARSARERLRTARIPRREGIVVDGDLSDWTGVEPLLFDAKAGKRFPEFTVPEPYPGARLYLAWSGEGLAVAVDVEDDQLTNNYTLGRLWDGDCLELFLETDLTGDRTIDRYTDSTFQFLLAPTSGEGTPAGVVTGNPRLPGPTEPEGVELAAARTERGWVLEARLGPAALFGWAPSAGALVGFTAALDDADGGDRHTQRFWRAGTDACWSRLEFARALFLP